MQNLCKICKIWEICKILHIRGGGLPRRATCKTPCLKHLCALVRQFPILFFRILMAKPRFFSRRLRRQNPPAQATVLWRFFFPVACTRYFGVHQKSGKSFSVAHFTPLCRCLPHNTPSGDGRRGGRTLRGLRFSCVGRGSVLAGPPSTHPTHTPGHS